MRRLVIRSLLVTTALVMAAGADWLHFRGPDNRSVATGGNLPVAMAKDGPSDEEQNVAWKAALPGRGVSSPIVVAGKAIVTSDSGFNHDRLHVLCIDAQTGKMDW